MNNLDIFIYCVSMLVTLVRIGEQVLINKKPVTPRMLKGALIACCVPIFNTILAIISVHRWINPKQGEK